MIVSMTNLEKFKKLLWMLGEDFVYVDSNNTKISKISENKLEDNSF